MIALVALLTALVAPTPTTLPAAKARALAAMRAGKPAEAVQAWRTHLAVHPRDAEARTAYGRCLGMMRRFPEALAELRAVLKRYPRDVDVRAALARVLAWSGDLRGAMREAKRALAIDALATDARLVVADVLYWRGHPREASVHYARALVERDDPQVRKRYVRVLMAARRFDSAEIEARRLLRSRPGDSEARKLFEEAERAGLSGDVELSLTGLEAGRVHPWWRLHAAIQARVSTGWTLSGRVEHLWRDFQKRDEPPGGSVGFVRDTVIHAGGAYRGGRVSLGLGLAVALQATFTPRLTFEAIPGYEVVKAVVVELGYRGLGFEGQYSQLFMPAVTWYFGNHHLSGRYFLALVHPLGDSGGSTDIGHAAMVRVGGQVLPWLGWYAGLSGGLAFVVAANNTEGGNQASAASGTNPALSLFGGLNLLPTPFNGIRVEYEYYTEALGDNRQGTYWHALRLAYYRRF